MEHLSNFLRLEISKYKDIDHIFAKMEQDGEIERVFTLFKTIFENESEFTIGGIELLKIEREKGEKISIKDQYKTNLSLFKSNLLLIVQMIIDNAFKTVVADTTYRLKGDKNQAPTQTEVNGNQEEVTEEHEQGNSEPQSAEKKSPGKPKKKTKTSLKANSSTSNLSPTVERRQSADVFPKKSSLSQLSTSKVNSPLNQILHSPKSASQNQSVRIDQNKSLTKDISHSSIKNYNSNTSFLSSRNPNDLSVQSEFNYIKGSATFAQSKRGIWEYMPTSPGPAAYNTEKSTPSKLKRSPSPTIGKAPKGSWLDICAKTDSPGPGGLYPSMHFIKK